MFIQIVTESVSTPHQFYYDSPIAVGFPIYLALIAYTLRNVNKVSYCLVVLVIGISAFVNTIGFPKVKEFGGFNRSVYQLNSYFYPELKQIRKDIQAGKIHMLDQKFVNLKRAENWTLVDNQAGLVDIKDTHHTFPLLYYYLLPYIQEGKVLIRDEYKEFIRYSKQAYGS